VSEDRHSGGVSAQTADYLEGLMEGFVAYDRQWRLIYINAAGEKLLGRRRADIVGKTWHEAFPHAVGNPVDAMYQRVMRERRAERMEYFYPHYGRSLELAAAPVRSGGIGVYFRDISDRVHALEALREADRRKDEFLAMLAHELRNPLAPIRNGVQLLRMDGVADIRTQTLDMIDRQTGHLVRLVDDLLDVSRITSGKMALQKTAVELSAVVASAVETCRPAIEAARHALVIELPHESLPVHADFVRLAQVVSNLLGNAARYTAQGGRIELRLRRDGRDALLSVADNGIGIAPEILPRIFEMFMQGGRDPRGALGGLGIGLALAKNLVELHGGTIEAKSDGADRGAQFAIRLPLLGAQPAAAGRPAPRLQRARAPRRVGGGRQRRCGPLARHAPRADGARRAGRARRPGGAGGGARQPAAGGAARHQHARRRRPGGGAPPAPGAGLPEGGVHRRHRPRQRGGPARVAPGRLRRAPRQAGGAGIAAARVRDALGACQPRPASTRRCCTTLRPRAERA
jgi:PAS domain S-box-containing protein